MFNVTPTSGAAPYTFTASFLNAESFSLGFKLRFSLSDATAGSCPLPETASNVLPIASEALLNTGVYVSTVGTVPSGSCSIYVLAILDSDNNVIQSVDVTVNNV